jgi:hypothetical protein
MAGSTPELTAAKQDAFLYHFSLLGVVSAAATMAGISRRIVYEWSKDDAFSKKLDEAKKAAYDVLLLEARRRAVEGCKEPIVSGGKIIGVKLVYSDTLLQFLMKSWRPELHTDKWEGNLKAEMDNTIHYHVPEGALVDAKGNDAEPPGPEE